MATTVITASVTHCFHFTDRIASAMQVAGALILHFLAFLSLSGLSFEITFDDKIFKEFENIRSRTPPDVQGQAVRDLITRLLPEHASQFVIVIQPLLGEPNMDVFEYTSTADSKLQIKGTSGVACSLGLQHFLKNYCQVHISWSGDQLNIPKPFPSVKGVIKISLPYR